MPRGSKAQLQKFTEGLALGYKAVKAAQYAGYPDGTSFKSNAYKRAQRADVKVMVEAFKKPVQEKVMQRMEITLQTLIDRAMRIYNAAIDAAQCGAAATALKELGILSGKRTERSEPGEFEHMTDEELQRAVAESAEQLGFVPKTETKH
jgi:hypothetical protein